MATFKFNWTSPLSSAILVSHPPVLKNKQTYLWSCPHDRSVPLDTVCLSLSSFLLLAPSHLVCSVAVKWHSGRCLMTEVCVSLSIQLCTIDWVWSGSFIWIEDNRRPVPAGFGLYWTYNDAQNHLCLCWFATQAGESCPEVICHSSCTVLTLFSQWNNAGFISPIKDAPVKCIIPPPPGLFVCNLTFNSQAAWNTLIYYVFSIKGETILPYETQMTVHFYLFNIHVYRTTQVSQGQCDYDCRF